MTTRAKLRQALTKRFLPELHRRGFTGPNAVTGKSISHEFHRVANNRTEHLSVQFEKRGKPRFILNIWIEPPGGTDAIIQQGGVFIQGRIAPNRGIHTFSWFRADRPWWQRLFGAKSTLEEYATDQALSYLDAVEDWFREPRDTPAVRMIQFDWSRIKNEKCA